LTPPEKNLNLILVLRRNGLCVPLPEKTKKRSSLSEIMAADVVAW
jgi:hypothetical protein